VKQGEGIIYDNSPKDHAANAGFLQNPPGVAVTTTSIVSPTETVTTVFPVLESTRLE